MMSNKFMRLIASIMVCITIFTTIDFGAFAYADEAMESVGNQDGYYLDGTPVTGQISTFAISGSSMMTTWSSAQKTDYYDDMISFIQSSTNPDLDRQTGAYGTGGYTASGAWSCSGWVAAVLHNFPTMNVTDAEFSGVNTASPDNIQLNYFEKSSDWTRVANVVDSTEYSSVAAAKTQLAKSSESLNSQSSYTNTFLKLKNYMEQGIVKAGDVIMFYMYPQAGVYVCHAAIVSDKGWNIYVGNTAYYSPAVINPSSGSNAVQYSNAGAWFQDDGSSGPSVGVCRGFAVYRFNSVKEGSVKLYKTSMLNGADHRIGNSNYSLEGAEFNLYYSATGTPTQNSLLVGKFKTNAGGLGYVTYNRYGGSTGGGVYTLSKLPLGNYLVVETVVPENHKKAPNQTFSITENNYEETITLTFDEPAIYGELDLIKISSCTDITDDNNMYDLSGAVYKVYTDEACTKQAYKVSVNSNGETSSNNVALAQFETDSTGNAAAIHILHGTYYIKETVAPEGFELDTNVYKVIVGNDTTPQANVTIKAGGYHSYDSNRFTLTVSDNPVNDPITIEVEKSETDNTVTEGLSLAGAIFKISYYDDYYNSLSDLPTEATRSWYVQTKLENDKYIAGLKEEYIVNNSFYTSDELYYDSNSNIPVLPLGTITISEIQAADGFVTNSGTVVDDKGNEYSNRTFIGQIKEDGSATDGASVFGINGTVTGVRFTNLTLNVTNAPTNVEITKYDITGSKELPGAWLQVLDKLGNVIDEWVSTDEAHIIEGKLIAGETYTLKEIKAPDGYVVAEEVTFTVSTDGSIDYVEMIDDTTKVEVDKIGLNEFGGTVGNRLAGVKLQILDAETKAVIYEWITDGTPHLIEGKLIYGKTYILHEAEAPEGYYTAEDIEFTVGATKTSITMYDNPTEVSISKNGSLYDEALEGAHMQIQDLSGNVMIDWISDGEPFVVTGLLKVGEIYILHEEQAPEGYAYISDQQFTIEDNNTVKYITVTDEPTYVTVTKYDEDGKILPGSHMQIQDMKGTVILDWITSENAYVIEGILIAGNTYILREVSAPAGYTVAEDIEFTVSKDGSVDEVKMIDLTTKVKISKKTITGSDELPGAWLLILDLAGNLIEEWISETEPHYIEAKLEAGKTYILHEEVSAPGYAYASDIEFTVSEDGTVDVVEMIDKPTTIEITKIAENTGKPLAGSHLQIQDSERNVKEEWISTEEAHTITAKLIAGETYILHEVEAPIGYNVAADIEFTVSKDGSIDSIEMVDLSTKVKISKMDITGTKEVPGSLLQIQDLERNVKEEWISGTEPHYIEAKLEAGKTYILHEEVSAPGYAYASDIEFTVSEDGTVDEVVMKDDTTKVEVNKYDENGELLSGSHMQIKDVAGNVMLDWITTDKAYLIEGILIAGETYILHEVSAPVGYIVADDIEFTVSKDGSIDSVDMIDLSTKVKISKMDITGTEEVEGALLQIKDLSGNVMLRWISGTEPYYIEAELEAGKTYILHEEVSAPGYAYASDIEFTVSEDGTVDEVVMKDDTTKIEVNKIAENTGKPLAGAEMQIQDLNGNVMLEWITTEEAYLIEGILIAGETYILHEVSAPDGYVVAEDIEFTVSKDGSIDSVEMIDLTTKVYISKIDGATEKPLAGAKLQLLTLDGIVVEEWITTDEVYLLENELVMGNTYILREVEVPAEYEFAEDIVFTVATDSDETHLEMKDYKIPDTPETGDNTHIWCLLILALASIITLLVGFKRNKQ